MFAAFKFLKPFRDGFGSGTFLGSFMRSSVGRIVVRLSCSDNLHLAHEIELQSPDLETVILRFDEQDLIVDDNQGGAITDVIATQRFYFAGIPVRAQQLFSYGFHSYATSGGQNQLKGYFRVADEAFPLAAH